MSMQPSSLRHTQNFLRKPSLVERLVARSSISGEDLVYEIGAGRGVITAALAARCRHVVAVEKDPALAAYLRARFAREPRVSVYTADFLCMSLPTGPYKVFASIPFAITTAIVGKLTSGVSPPEVSYLVVQREAAARFTGAPAETLAALLIKPWFEPSIVHRFDRSDFTPAPNVESVLLRLHKRGPPLLAPWEAQRYRDLVTYAFTAWRPTLYDTLRPLCGAGCCDSLWRQCRLSRSATPANVPFATWLALFRLLAARDMAALWITANGAERRLRRQQARLQKVHRTRTAPISTPG